MRHSHVPFLIFHLAAITLWSVVPKLGSPYWEQTVIKYLQNYIYFTGSFQKWTMFDRAPSIHSVHVRLLAKGPTGDKYFGPLLPGLKAYDRKNMRMYKFFIENKTNKGVIRSYLGRACLAVKMSGFDATEVWLKYEIRIIPRLGTIRENGKIMSQPHYSTSDRFQC